MLIAIVIVALVVIAAVVAVPRLRDRSRPARRVRARRRAPVDAMDEAELRKARDLPREEQVLIEEGQAIRAHVESRIALERPAAAHRAAGAGRTEEELAWQTEQEQRDRHPSTHGAPRPAYVEPGDEPVPAYGEPGPAYGTPGQAYGEPGSAYGAPGSGYGAPGSGYGAPGPGYRAPGHVEAEPAIDHPVGAPRPGTP